MNIFVPLQSSDIRTVCAEGLAKLMLSGRLVSSKVMSRLILLWYNPVTEDDTRLRHCLGAFFPVYAFSGRFVVLSIIIVEQLCIQTSVTFIKIVNFDVIDLLHYLICL